MSMPVVHTPLGNTTGWDVLGGIFSRSHAPAAPEFLVQVPGAGSRFRFFVRRVVLSNRHLEPWNLERLEPRPPIAASDRLRRAWRAIPNSFRLHSKSISGYRVWKP